MVAKLPVVGGLRWYHKMRVPGFSDVLGGLPLRNARSYVHGHDSCRQEQQSNELQR